MGVLLPHLQAVPGQQALPAPCGAATGAHPKAEREKVYRGESSVALERSIAALRISGVTRLGGVPRLPRRLRGTASLSIPVGGHSMPFGSNSMADHRADMQCGVPACCQGIGAAAAAVLPARGPSPLEARGNAGGAEESLAAEPGEAARDSCQTVSKRRDAWEDTLGGCGEVCVQVGGNFDFQKAQLQGCWFWK